MEPRPTPKPVPTLTTASSRDLGLWALLALFAVVAIYFSIKVPAFETPDEFQHYAFVQHVVTWYDLPKSEANTAGLWRQQGVQAPLYYVGGALVTLWVDQSNFQNTAHRVNRFAKLGQSDAQDNRNYFMAHADDGWPWKEEFLALHILRLFSVVLGCISLWAIHRFLQQLLSSRVALFSTAICAFIPQFVFISSAASNDNLVIASACLLIWRLAELIRKGQGNREVDPLHREAWQIGLLLAIALLAKLSGLGMLGVAGLAAIWVAWQRKSGRLLWQMSWRIAIPILLGACWWFGRNLWLYGDLLAWNIWEANITLRPELLDLTQLGNELGGLFQSFWGLFGWLTVPFPKFIYFAFACLSAILTLLFCWWVIKAVGLLQSDVYLFENGKFMQGFLAFLWLGVLTLSWLRFMLIAPAAQGRYFFPALTVAGLAIGLGVSTLPSIARKLAWALPVGLFAVCVMTPVWILDAAYTPPLFSQFAELKLDPQEAEVGQNINQPEFRLIGTHLPDKVVPGEIYPVFIRLETLGPISQDYAIFVHYRDTEGIVLAQYDGLPGGGLWPTTQWPTGETRTEFFHLSMPEEMATGVHGTVVIGFYNPWTWIRPYWRTPETNRSEPLNEITVGTFIVADSS